MVRHLDNKDFGGVSTHQSLRRWHHFDAFRSRNSCFFLFCFALLVVEVWSSGQKIFPRFSGGCNVTPNYLWEDQSMLISNRDCHFSGCFVPPSSHPTTKCVHVSSYMHTTAIGHYCTFNWCVIRLDQNLQANMFHNLWESIYIWSLTLEGVFVKETYIYIYPPYMRLYEMTITFLYEMGFGHPFYIEYVVSDLQNIFEHHRTSFYRGLLEQVCTSDGIVCKDAGRAFYRASRGIILLYVVKIKMSRGRTSSYRDCFLIVICFIFVFTCW